ncbi:uncharacterized protein LOC141595478 [Silene latifolia]|uniref:uncharacterized protein LOC141595478 n=1 Tax=Silene latifolia TaxID=37657 RepID=UPI003D775CCC
MWEYLKQRLPTKDRLLKMGLMIDQNCPICSSSPESHAHIVNECVYAKVCIRLLQKYLHINFRMQDLVHWYSAGRKVTKLQRRFAGACHVALIYWIWRIRNEARLDMVVRSPDAIVKLSMDEVKTRFLKQNTKPLKIKDQTWFQALGT